MGWGDPRALQAENALAGQLKWVQARVSQGTQCRCALKGWLELKPTQAAEAQDTPSAGALAGHPEPRWAWAGDS